VAAWAQQYQRAGRKESLGRRSRHLALARPQAVVLARDFG